VALDPCLWTMLERYGLTNAHLEQLVALCHQQAGGSVKWHTDADGFVKMELTIHVPMRDVRRMQDLKKMMQKEGDVARHEP
jgi:hypothetical protein